VCYLDCDVEEPNGHIFLKPRINVTQPVGIPVPKVDENLCSLCGECAVICAYSAIVRIADTILTFPEMCHGCGGCMLVCPDKAIREIQNEIGIIEMGDSNGVRFVHGKLNVGSAISPPLIREVLSNTDPEQINIIDAPPGTSCPVIQSIKDADYVLLVSEPTPFGLSDLKLTVEVLEKLQVPHGLVINRCNLGSRDMWDYCRMNSIEILIDIPHDRKIAEICSNGELIIGNMPDYTSLFEQLGEIVISRARIAVAEKDRNLVMENKTSFQE